MYYVNLNIFTRFYWYLWVRFLVPCKWNFLFPSVTCIVYSVVALNVSLTLLCDDAEFK